jgi:predicted DsbA family dithiol-disulfide isomerase
MSRTLSIQVSFDLVCPWCLIGKHNLQAALEELRAKRPSVSVEIDWRSFPLLPGIPQQGLPFEEFYLRRLGSPSAVAMRQAQVLDAARAAGVEIAFDRIQTFPNTLDAHRLVARARRQGGFALAGAVIDALFDAYFTQGRDIGDATVLAQVAADHGVAPDGNTAAPVARGGHGVPYFLFNGRVEVEGAQRPQVLLDAMLRALASEPTSPVPRTAPALR